MGRRVALVTRAGILVAEGDDGAWSATVTDADASPECVLADGRRPDRLWVGTADDGLWRSSDGGGRFARVGAGAIEPEAVTALAVDPADPDHLWVGTEPSRLYRSPDAGASWERVRGLAALPSAGEWSFPPRPHTHHVRWIEIDPVDPERIYVGIEAGALVRTTDGGDTWHDRPPGSLRDNHTLATHPDAPGRVYAAAGDGYAESTDGGETWARRHDGLAHPYVWGLAVDRGDPETVVASAAASASSAHRAPGEAYLYRRSAGAGWTRLDDGGVPTGPGTRRAVLAAGPAAGELVAGTTDGLFRSTDGGAAWSRLPVDQTGSLAGALPRGLCVVARP